MSILATLAQIARPILEFAPIRRTRRNHSLEHATIHVLSQRVRNMRVGGHSSIDGFVLIGTPTQEQVESASQEALNRLKKGEKALAIHPNCGTNFTTTAFLATVVALISGRVKNLITPSNRFSLTFSAMFIALLVGQPLGMALQKHFTTKDEMGDLELDSVKQKQVNIPLTGQTVNVYQVHTRKG